MTKILPAIICCWVAGNCVWAQSNALSNKRHKVFPVAEEGVLLDSLTAIPHTLVISDLSGQVPFDTSDYTIRGNQLVWDTLPEVDSVKATFRVAPYAFHANLYKRDTLKIAPTQNGNYIGFDYKPYETGEGIIDLKGLDYTGSFSRGISVGNNQDLVLNSSFNLQLSGDLGDDIEVLAAISDNNIPLQPEGNTQQLQEFDRIFIQLKRRNSALTAGDYELAKPYGYFTNYFKKLQGATFSHDAILKNEASLNTSASIAISRGKFARNEILAEEGNQGPYRLDGADGESFIIILAGTEKVFVDGKLMRRGIEYDYVIDYNRGDITFTNRQLMTKDKRIIVEFEYSDQQYLRSLYSVNSIYEKDKWKLYFNLFSQQDSKTSGEARNLSQSQKIALRDAGDAIDNIVASGERPASESTNPINYWKVPNPYFCNGDSIFVYDSTGTDPDNASRQLFAVSFSRVAGGGDYIRVDSFALGTVYVYSPRDENCQPTGEYAPLIQLISPKQNQLYAVGAEYNLSKNTSFKTEVALSNTDLNRFSEQDEQDDAGIAVSAAIEHRMPLGKKENSWEFGTGVQYEWVQENFRALNPYRVAEFRRDWNLEGTQGGNLFRNEHLGVAFIDLGKGTDFQLNYGLNGYSRDSLLEGLRHDLDLKMQLGGFNLHVFGTYLDSRSTEETTKFSRPRILLSQTIKPLKNIEIGFYGEREKNSRRSITAEVDTLINTSFYYDVAKFFIQNPEDENLHFNISYLNRWDFAPVNREFEQSTRAEEVNINGKWKAGRASNLRWNFTYRDLQINDTSLINLDASKTYLGRLDYTLLLWKGAVRSNTTYEIGTGQERKIDFVYREIQPGEIGTHLWVDRDSNGVIGFDEVEIAPFADAANLIQITLVTDEFIRTNNITYNQSFRLEPRIVWGNKEGFLKALGKFSGQASFRILRKTLEDASIQPYNPFQGNIPDTSLVSVNSIIRGDIFFNRANAVYDLQWGIQDSRNRVTLTTGYESRQLAEQFLRGRLNFTKEVSAIVKLTKGKQLNDSRLFNSRDYNIDFYAIEPNLTWQPSAAFRGTVSFQYRESRNLLPEGGEASFQSDMKVEGIFNSTSSTSIRTSFTYSRVAFSGKENTPAGFAMLNGLQKGNNFLWELNFDRRLSSNIQLSLGYQGRKTGTARVVHVGQAEIRALF